MGRRASLRVSSTVDSTRFSTGRRPALTTIPLSGLGSGQVHVVYQSCYSWGVWLAAMED